MKAPLIAIITGAALGAVALWNGLHIDIAAYVVILFGTGLVAWTIEQYRRRSLH
ncbi:MAG: hypothetical protein HYX71_10705 [Opitutae bacterium]|nr:hypothetical protein [Opitutae bacterium]